jgi:adenosine deaminase
MVDQAVAALPKADRHLPQAAAARLERLPARRQGRPPYDRRGRAARLMAEQPPGLDRLGGVYAPDDDLDLTGIQRNHPDTFVARVGDVLSEAAADGAVLAEVRFGPADAPPWPAPMPLFREAERQVRARFPMVRAEAIGYVLMASEPARLRQAEARLEAILAASALGLAGADFSTEPYDSEADPALWAVIARWAERAAAAGLGISIHAGEFSSANLAAALRVPGLGRIGHAVHAAHNPRLLDQLARSGATGECSLSSNVVLSAVPSYEAHPIRRFTEYGIPVMLNTDLPVHVCTTIGREFAVAALDFSPAELLALTRNAIRASFASSERRRALADARRRDGQFVLLDVRLDKLDVSPALRRLGASLQQAAQGQATDNG